MYGEEPAVREVRVPKNVPFFIGVREQRFGEIITSSPPCPLSGDFLYP